MPLGVLDDLELGIDRELLELGHEKLVITALFGHQFAMAAILKDRSAFHEKDAVAGDDGGKAVGDDDGRPSLQDAIHGFLDLGFGEGVDGRSGFVQDQECRVS